LVWAFCWADSKKKLRDRNGGKLAISIGKEGMLPEGKKFQGGLTRFKSSGGQSNTHRVTGTPHKEEDPRGGSVNGRFQGGLRGAEGVGARQKLKKRRTAV